MERIGEDAEKARCRRAHEIPDSTALEGVTLLHPCTKKDLHREVAAYAWYICKFVHNPDEAKLLYSNEFLPQGDVMSSLPVKCRNP